MQTRLPSGANVTVVAAIADSYSVASTYFVRGIHVAAANASVLNATLTRVIAGLRGSTSRNSTLVSEALVASTEAAARNVTTAVTSELVGLIVARRKILTGGEATNLVDVIYSLASR